MKGKPNKPTKPTKPTKPKKPKKPKKPTKPKKRCRKPKNKTNVIITKPKKRGRKPKGGKIVTKESLNEKQNLEVVTVICDILDKKLGLLSSGKPRKSLIAFVKDRLGHDRRYAIDASKIEQELGWKPKMSFEKGMEKTVDWYLANQQWVGGIVDGSYQQYYNEMYYL